jgi:hypothetical protein
MNLQLDSQNQLARLYRERAHYVVSLSGINFKDPDYKLATIRLRTAINRLDQEINDLTQLQELRWFKTPDWPIRAEFYPA